MRYVAGGFILTEAQARALRFSNYQPLLDGVIEQQIELGIKGAALAAVIKALQRKALIDSDGLITVSGIRALQDVRNIRAQQRVST